MVTNANSNSVFAYALDSVAVRYSFLGRLSH